MIALDADGHIYTCGRGAACGHGSYETVYIPTVLDGEIGRVKVLGDPNFTTLALAIVSICEFSVRKSCKLPSVSDPSVSISLSVCCNCSRKASLRSSWRGWISLDVGEQL